jgi:hypothetical protein
MIEINLSGRQTVSLRAFLVLAGCWAFLFWVMSPEKRKAQQLEVDHDTHRNGDVAPDAQDGGHDR